VFGPGEVYVLMILADAEIEDEAVELELGEEAVVEL
jgi:hypothetical protein